MRKSMVLLAVAAAFGLSGCMSSSDAGLAKSQFYDDIDWHKMSIITQEARLRGHDIVWINPPTKKKSDSSNR